MDNQSEKTRKRSGSFWSKVTKTSRTSIRIWSNWRNAPTMLHFLGISSAPYIQSREHAAFLAFSTLEGITHKAESLLSQCATASGNSPPRSFR